MHVSLFQCDTAGLTPEQRIENLRDTAWALDTDLIVCPELFLSGYAISDDVTSFAEPSNGPSARKIAQIAKDTGTAIIYGYPEAAEDAQFNSAQCINADGQFLANHRKLVLPPGFEADILTPGDRLTLFTLQDIVVGLLICYDAEFPETVRSIAEAGAHIVVVPTALTSQWGVVANRVIPARAFENGVYLLYANYAGTEGDMTYLGESCIVGPDGKDLTRAGSAAEIISAPVDRALVMAAQARLPYHQDVQTLRSRLVLKLPG